MSTETSLTTGHVLLVRKHEQQRVLHFPILNDARQLGAGLVYPVAILGVDDENETLCAYIPAPNRPCQILVMATRAIVKTTSHSPEK